MVRAASHRTGSLQAGLVSSHFFFLILHVMQPVLERPLGGFVIEVGCAIGCFRGLPRGRFATVRSGEGTESSAMGEILELLSSSSSISSILGMTLSTGEGSGMNWKSITLGVVRGDSLDEGEAWLEEEEMLKRAPYWGG